MKFIKTLVSLVAVLSLFAVMATGVSAASFAEIESVEVAGIEALDSSSEIATFAGDTLPVRIIFFADEDQRDVRIKAWISGEKGLAESSDRFDVIANRSYSRFLSVDVPFDLDDLDQDRSLRILIESEESEGQIVSIDLTAQRESYLIDVISVAMDPTAQAGEPIQMNIVLKNRGRQLAEDAFVKVSVPALDLEQSTYFGDLSPLDQAHPDKEDAVERRMFLNIPADAPASVYDLQIEAFSEDSATIVNKKFAVVGASGTSTVVSSSSSKTFAPGEVAEFNIALVNSGNNVRVYEVIVDSPTGLSVVADQSFVVVSAGMSETVKVMANSAKEDVYPFSVNVVSDGNLVTKKDFVANVEGKKVSGKTVGTANATVVLTVILAIIFVVLLVVLIVLLTRKPQQRSDEFGESYY